MFRFAGTVYYAAHDCHFHLFDAGAEPLVDLVVGAEEGDTFAGEWLDDEDLHAPTSMPVAAPIASSPARCAAATPVPGTTGRPVASRLSSMTPIAARISSSVTVPRWPIRKTSPLSFACPPATTSLRALSAVLNAFQSRPSGSHAQVTVSEAWADRRTGGSPGHRGPRGSRRHRQRDGRNGLGPLRVHQAHRDIELEQDAERGRERGLAGGHALAIQPGVEVEARHLRGLGRLPGARGDAQEGHPRARPSSSSGSR